MMDRRGFIGRLLGGLAAAAMAPALDLLPAAEAATPISEAIASGVVPTYRSQFDRLCYEAMKVLAQQMPGDYELVHDRKFTGRCEHLNVAIHEQETLSAQTFEEAMDRYIAPAVVMLAEEAKARRVQSFGVLPVPPGAYQSTVVTHQQRGISIRGTCGYSIWEDLNYFRLDILVGVHA